MDKECKNFIQKCSNSHTTITAFIQLFIIWDKLTPKQRREIIDFEVSLGRISKT